MRLLQRLDWARMVLGICMIIDGYPLIFFLKETLRLAPGSTAFTALFQGVAFILMIPFTLLRRIYRPNVILFWIGVIYLGFSLFYLFTYNSEPGLNLTNELLYYLFIFAFLFLLLNIPNGIIEVFLPVVILFTTISNLALLYAMITDTTWMLGMRAAIFYGGGDGERTGNPHVFARNAIMALIACGIWFSRPKTTSLGRSAAVILGLFSTALLVMTQTRSSVLALLLITALFMFYNVRPAQIRSAVRSLFSPISLIVIGLLITGMAYFIQRNQFLFDIIFTYASDFIERNTESLLALLGIDQGGIVTKAQVDASSITRVNNYVFFERAFGGHFQYLVLGFGYKYLYVDVPLIESFVDQGFVGLILFGGMGVLGFYFCLQAIRTNPNPLTTFVAYFCVYIFVLFFTNGRPFDVSFWYPLALLIRFVGNEHYFPAHLQNAPLRLA